MFKPKFNKIRASVGEIVPPTKGDKDILVQLEFVFNEIQGVGENNMDNSIHLKGNSGEQQKIDFDKTSL